MARAPRIAKQSRSSGKLREKAEKARGKKSITTRFHDAKVAEAWGKSLKAQLPQPVEGAALATRVLGEMWRCASQPVRRTIAPRSVVRSPADVFEANKKPPSMDQGCAEPRDSSSHDRMKLPRDAAFADGEPFAYIDDDAYDRAASLYEASKRAGVAVGPAPLNPEQRDGGRDFLQVAQLRRATAQRGEPIQCIPAGVGAERRHTRGRCRRHREERHGETTTRAVCRARLAAAWWSRRTLASRRHPLAARLCSRCSTCASTQRPRSASRA